MKLPVLFKKATPPEAADPSAPTAPAPRPARKKKFKISKVLIPLVLLGLAGGGYYYYTTTTAANSNPYASLRTAKAEKGSVISTIGANGNVRAYQTANLTFGTGGKVGEIKAALRQKVNSNDLLASLDQTTVIPSIISAQNELISIDKTILDLKNQSIQNQTIAAAQKRLAAAEKAYSDAKTALESKKYQRGTQAQIESAEAEYIIALDELQKTEDLYANFSIMDTVRRADALTRIASARTRRDRALANLNYLKGLPDKIDVDVAQAAFQSAEAELSEAKRTLAEAQAGPKADDLTIQENKRIITLNTINQAKILAPFAGTVTDIKIKPGDMVTSSTAAFRIDDLSTLFIDLQVTEIDINKVKVGQPVTITFDAITNKTYNGEVSLVSLVGVSTQGVINFTVTIKMKDPDEQVKPGMTASASIVVEQVNNVLVVLNRTVKTYNNNRYVMIMEEGKPRWVPVRLGATSETNSQVMSGQLQEGMLVVTNPPTPTANFGGGGMFGFGGSSIYPTPPAVGSGTGAGQGAGGGGFQGPGGGFPPGGGVPPGGGGGGGGGGGIIIR